ncbi:hypothetical protein PAHAL_5G290800 [Panicum hallii]|uniref:Uncharacterized protein n=1 Tax=Panicum hallii TaxID=206008 RepID=A0A2T8ILN5_9POAL|nr:hypothetical protein PAHAL_5G290800 [Panicum hallii]
MHKVDINTHGPAAPLYLDGAHHSSKLERTSTPVAKPKRSRGPTILMSHSCQIY